MNAERNLSVDLLRFIAAVGVIFIHLGPSTELAETATRPFLTFVVPFFFLVSLYFFIRKVSQLQFLSIAEFRLDRIAVPYAVWSTLYISVQLLRIQLGGPSHIIDPVGVIFYGGGAIHLYFLSSLLLFQAQALAVIVLFRAPINRWAGLAFAGGIIMISYVGSAEEYFGMNDALQRGWLYVAMAFLLVGLQATKLGRTINAAIGWLSVVGVLATASSVVPWNASGVWQAPLVGYGMVAFALNQRVSFSSPWLRFLVSCSYGIYLVHFAFLQGIALAALKFRVALTPYTLVTKPLMAAVICSCCVGFIALARKYRFLAYLLMGEGSFRELRLPSISEVESERVTAL